MGRAHGPVRPVLRAERDGVGEEGGCGQAAGGAGHPVADEEHYGGDGVMKREVSLFVVVVVEEFVGRACWTCLLDVLVGLGRHDNRAKGDR